MKAIILTYDQQIGLAELVYKAYARLWPNCPFDFLIPCNNPDNKLFHRYLAKRDNVTLMPSPPDIRGTMESLLESIEDEEWVYWAIDDRYPIRIDVTAMEEVYQFVTYHKSANIN